jgi:membrane-bound lytic murein transglycosylase B
MLRRRALLLTGSGWLAARPASAQSGMAGQAGSFTSFLAGVRPEARRAGVSEDTITRACAGISANQKVIDLDRRQPEFTQTWAQYRASRLSDTRIAQGRGALSQNRGLLDRIATSYGVPPSIILGVWGLETNYGTYQGGFNVVEALATLAWEGRRAAYFRAELIASLKVLDHGDVTPGRMVGSYAGAMGQPQFMPSSFNRYAVDFDQDGRRDIWDDRADALASIANYLALNGWRAGEPWGQPVRLAADFPPGITGRDNRRPLGAWMDLGVRRLDGTPFSRRDVPGAIVLPDGAGGEAFMVYANFTAIRRYNPSDYYALAVGLLGEAVAS